MAAYDQGYSRRIAKTDSAIPARSGALGFRCSLTNADSKLDKPNPNLLQHTVSYDEDVFSGLDITPENIVIAGINPFKSASRRTWRLEQTEPRFVQQPQSAAPPSNASISDSFSPTFSSNFSPTFASPAAAPSSSSVTYSSSPVSVSLSITDELLVVFRNDVLEKADHLASVGIDIHPQASLTASTQTTDQQMVKFEIELAGNPSQAAQLSKLSINKKYIQPAMSAYIEATHETVPPTLSLPFQCLAHAHALLSPPSIFGQQQTERNPLSEEHTHKLLKVHAAPSQVLTDFMAVRTSIKYQGSDKALISVSLTLQNPAVGGGAVLSDVSVQVSITPILQPQVQYEHINVKIRPAGTYNVANKVIHFTPANPTRSLTPGSGPLSPQSPAGPQSPQQPNVFQFDAIIDVSANANGASLETSVTNHLPVIVRGLYADALVCPALSACANVTKVEGEAEIAKALRGKVEFKFLR